jgi:arabinan endo-1,5-alpha-L-arabinosidase
VTSAREPVWDGYCADPFVLRHSGGWTMYGSAPAALPDGRLFQTLHSPDLVTWTDTGGALEPLAHAPAGTEYWAPEVMAADGAFWMYYSAGVGDEGHHQRVAKAADPGGPFQDVGVDLTPDLPFAIDPSPFLDTDGTRWLFFATDRLGGERPGTVLAVAPLTSTTSLGEHRVILTATADWQRYQADRSMYGQVLDWHTLEGPQVVHRLGRYWLCYSAGNWHDASYGVGLAVADSPLGPWQLVREGAAFVDSPSSGLTGPGHNSLVSDLEGTDHAVFHAWDSSWSRRRPYVVPVGWTPEGPSLLWPG